MQSIQLIVCDVGAFILLEPENEEPSVSLIGRDKYSRTAAFTATGKPNPLLHDATTEIGVNQTLSHFRDCIAKYTVGQFGFSHPAGKVPCFEYAFHVQV